MTLKMIRAIFVAPFFAAYPIIFYVIVIKAAFR